jgi:hypothetical protein
MAVPFVFLVIPFVVLVYKPHFFRSIIGAGPVVSRTMGTFRFLYPSFIFTFRSCYSSSHILGTIKDLWRHPKYICRDIIYHLNFTTASPCAKVCNSQSNPSSSDYAVSRVYAIKRHSLFFFRNIGMSTESLWFVASRWTLFCFLLVLYIFTAAHITYFSTLGGAIMESKAHCSLS